MERIEILLILGPITDKLQSNIVIFIGMDQTANYSVFLDFFRWNIFYNLNYAILSNVRVILNKDVILGYMQYTCKRKCQLSCKCLKLLFLMKKITVIEIRFAVVLNIVRLGYSEHSFITNKIFNPKWPFTTRMYSVITNKFGRSQAVRYNRVWL